MKPKTTPRLTLPSKRFLIDVRFQLKLQSRESNDGPGGHPDPVIRKFYRAVDKIISKKLFIEYRDLIVGVHQKRPGMNTTHFVNLWFRAIQYILRKRREKDYVNYTVAGWKKYLNTTGREDITSIRKILLSKNTATHVPVRYRSFNTALRLIVEHHPDIDLRIGDIGCSLGLGLKACLANGFLTRPPFTDNTPKQQVLNCFARTITRCSRAVGIDIRIPTIDWVKACNYPSRYTSDATAIDHAASKLTDIPFKVNIRQADILDPKTIDILTVGKPLLAIYSSMSLYELPHQDRLLAYRHIASALCQGGVFIEFTFCNPDNWFKGIHTVVRVNHSGKLSSPLIWHLWKDSRCSAVRPGKDYRRVNLLLAKIGNKI